MRDLKSNIKNKLCSTCLILFPCTRLYVTMFDFFMEDYDDVEG